MRANPGAGLVLLAALFALTGCGPPQDEARLLLMDEGARMAGTMVQLEHWEGSPAFAVRLTPGERPLLVSQTDSRRLDIPAHMLAYVEGMDAQVRLLELDRDVAPDALILNGPEGAARRVAGLLDATVESLGGDRYRLSGPELLDRSAFLEPPRGLRDVQPVERAPAALGFLGERPEQGPASASWGDPARAAVEPISLAGIYVGEETTLVLDAEGGFTLQRGCGEAERGTAFVNESGISLVTSRAGRTVIQLIQGELVGANGERLRPYREEQP